MPSIKQIVPICFTLSFIIFPNFTFADNITASSTCTNGVLGTYTGPADIEANFDPNTINTTWYSNGTQLTGNNIPATCTYDNALTPPTPEDRPGYVFGGWSVIVPPCEIPSSLVSNDGGSKGYKNDSTSPFGAYSLNTSDYGLTQDNTWGVTWSNGDKVVGEAICSQTSGTWATAGTPDTTGAGTTKYCWCRATGYIASGSSQCSLSSSSWVFNRDRGSADSCAHNCAGNCAGYVYDTSDFRAAVLGAAQ